MTNSLNQGTSRKDNSLGIAFGDMLGTGMIGDLMETFQRRFSL